MTPASVSAASAVDATAAADAAARAAGVQLRELTAIADLQLACRFYEGVWRSPPVSADLLRALTTAGNYQVGAFCDGELVGACLGFFGPPVPEAVLYSHLAAVSDAARGRSVGFAVKLHQRAWALSRGATAITWTFDPLIRRNAHFNLTKLRATAVEYVPHFYGDVPDGINAGDETDRLRVRWDLTDATVAAACRHAAPEAPAPPAPVVLRPGADGRPRVDPSEADRQLLGVPVDIERLRASDPGRARLWRLALRELLMPLLAGGYRVVGFDKDGWYVVQRTGGTP